MKKRSNRNAYEKRKGKINADAMTSFESQEINEENSKIAETREPVVEELPTRKSKSTVVEEKAPLKEAPQKSERHQHQAPQSKKKRGKQGRTVLISTMIVLAVIFLFIGLYSTFGGTAPFHAAFTFNSATAISGSKTITMDNSIYLAKDTAMAPLEGLGEVLPISVKWDEKSNKATVKGNGVKLELEIDKTAIEINGEKQKWDKAPILKKGVVYVPLVAFCQAFGYETSYADSISRVDVFMPGEKNKVPTASFTTNKDSYEVGETVTYKVETNDPDGDEIVDYLWQNNQKSFTEVGEVVITLSVQDSRGAVSEEASKTITINAPANADNE